MSLALPITISNYLEGRVTTTTSRILNQDPDLAGAVADSVVELFQTDLGYEPEEAIPGLVAAIVVFALMTENPRQALDEAIDLLVGQDPEGEEAPKEE